MAAAIRASIVGALETMLATITVANGYRTEVASVETAAKDERCREEHGALSECHACHRMVRAMT